MLSELEPYMLSSKNIISFFLKKNPPRKKEISKDKKEYISLFIPKFAPFRSILKRDLVLPHDSWLPSFFCFI